MRISQMKEKSRRSKDNVSWSVEGKIKEGQQQTLATVMEEMVEATRKEPGSLIYEWSIGEDGKSLHVYERYENDAAAMSHLSTWKQNAARFMSVVDITRITVYSALTPTLKVAFEGPGTVFMTPVGGFAR